jgi:hypothetical protein
MIIGSPNQPALISVKCANLIKESVQHVVAANKILETVQSDLTMDSDLFLESLYKIKQLINKSMDELYQQWCSMDQVGEDFQHIDLAIKGQNEWYSRIKTILILLINNENYRLRTYKKYETNDRMVSNWFFKLKQKENELYINFNTKDTSKFIELGKTYYEISEYMFISLLHFLDDKIESKDNNEQGFRVNDEIELNCELIEAFDQFLDAKTRAILTEIGDSLKQILEEYYQDENNTSCIEVVTKKLKATAKRNDFEVFSLSLDEIMKKLMHDEFRVSNMVNKFSNIWKDKSEKKVAIKQFVEIFKNFNRILIELEIDKPDKVIQLNEYYQYAYFFMFFKICLKVFLVLAFQASKKFSSDQSYGIYNTLKKIDSLIRN